MRQPGPPTNLEIANRLVPVMARKYREAFDRKVGADEMSGFARIGAAEALHHWNGKGNFEPFAIQRIRWAILRGARRWILKQTAAASLSGPHALVATERMADSIDETPDEVTTEPRGLIDQSIWGYRMELSFAEEEAQELADVDQDLERTSERLRLRRAVEMLPPPEDAVVKLHSYEDESFQDIGDSLGMGKSTVSDVFHRAVRRLQSWLDPPPPEDETGPPPPPPIPIRRSLSPPST